MKKVIAPLFLLISALAFSVNAAADEAGTYCMYKDIKSTYQHITEEDTLIRMPYHVYVPQNYDKSKKYPIVVILHGAGERGYDNQVHVNNTFLFNMASMYHERYPAIIILPQCPDDGWWSGIYTDCVMRIVDDVKSKYSADDDRLYITGYSMGGGGTWDIGVRYADRVAALVPICGTSSDSGIKQGAPILKNIPIWIFHGKLDGAVPFSVSESWNEALKAAGNRYVQFTIYGWKDHAIWSTAWNEPNLYKWMFSQIRGKPEVGLLWNEPGTSASATQTNTGGKDTSTSGSAVSSSNIDNEDSSAGPAGNKGGNRTGMVLYIILAVAVLGVGVGALAVICYRKKRAPKDGGI